MGDYSSNRDDHSSHHNQDANSSADMINHPDLKPTETDMRFDMFANKDKLVDKDEIRMFEKGQFDGLYGTGDPKTETADDYYKKDDDHYTETHDTRTEQDNDALHGSKHGPSYGEGKTYSDDTYNTGMSEEEEKLKKLNMLRQLGELADQGVTLSGNFNMSCSLAAMENEHKLHTDIRKKKNGTRWMATGMVFVAQGLEMANTKIKNPLNLKIDGWSQSVAKDQVNYYEVLGEIYEKWFMGKNSLPPELKLAGMLGFSALQFHFTQAMFGNQESTSAFMNKNPEMAAKLMQNAMEDRRRKEEAALNAGANKDMAAAQKRAADLEMLRAQEAEHLRQQQNQMQQQNYLAQMQAQQKQYQDLQDQLNAQRSDSMSMYMNNNNNLAGPSIPSRMVDRFPTMTAPTMSASEHNALRQQQILEHKRMMHVQAMNEDDNRSVVDINPNLEDIISRKSQNASSILNISEMSESEDGRVDVKRGRRN